MDALVTFLKGDYAFNIVSVCGAAVLWALARFLLPVDEQKRTRIALIYLALAIVFGLIEWITPDGSNASRTIGFFYWFFLLASCGRSLVLLAVDVVFAKRKHGSTPRIFRDLTQAVVYVIVVMLTLRAVGVEPGSLLTTSALLTAVVGLALQDTLGNMVSGLALQMQRPFEVGDWIQFEQDVRQIGQVTEVNWRATSVMTSDLVEVIVPNAMLAKAFIRNYSRPSRISRRIISVQGPYGSSPESVREAVMKAVVGTPGVLAEPAFWVQTKTFADSGIEYIVYFFIDDFAARERIDGCVRDRIWYAFQRAKIDIPFPTRTVQLHEMSESSAQRAHDRELDRRDAILRSVEFLDVLPPETHRMLAAAAEVRLFAPGEVVVSQGETGGELFIIDTGEVAVEVTHPGGRSAASIARLGSRKFFGEMSLLTGEVRAATVRAVNECVLLVVGHNAFHDTIAQVPGVVDKISYLLAERQAELEAVASERRPTIEPMSDRSQRLISQIKSFFKL